MTVGPIDYYPTPACAAKALLRRIKQLRIKLEKIIDPAAGRGALPFWLHPLGAKWSTYEICGFFEADLRHGGHDVFICNSLAAQWDAESHIIANPPYGKHLEPFVHKIHKHCRSNGVFGAVLMRTQWLDDGKDRHDRFKPDMILRLPWRVSYTGKGSPSETHCWAIYLPKKRGYTRVDWAEKPELSFHDKNIHRAMANIPVNQISLGLGTDEKNSKP